MIETECKVDRAEPPNKPPIATGMMEPGDIERLGDAIAGLGTSEASELARYLNDRLTRAEDGPNRLQGSRDL